MAGAPLVNRFAKVDFPTFGRPANTTTGKVTTGKDAPVNAVPARGVADVLVLGLIPSAHTTLPPSASANISALSKKPEV
jgi:hypothetical protein